MTKNIKSVCLQPNTRVDHNIFTHSSVLRGGDLWLHHFLSTQGDSGWWGGRVSGGSFSFSTGCSPSEETENQTDWNILSGMNWKYTSKSFWNIKVFDLLMIHQSAGFQIEAENSADVKKPKKLFLFNLKTRGAPPLSAFSFYLNISRTQIKMSEQQNERVKLWSV